MMFADFLWTIVSEMMINDESHLNHTEYINAMIKAPGENELKLTVIIPRIIIN